MSLSSISKAPESPAWKSPRSLKGRRGPLKRISTGSAATHWLPGTGSGSKTPTAPITTLHLPLNYVLSPRHPSPPPSPPPPPHTHTLKDIPSVVPFPLPYVISGKICSLGLTNLFTVSQSSVKLVSSMLTSRLDYCAATFAINYVVRVVKNN